MKRKTIKSRDVAEIIIGSLVLGIPLALTEEIWNLGEELSTVRVAMIVLASLATISFFVQTTYRHDFSFSSQKGLAARVLTVYGLTLAVVAIVLLMIDRLPFLTETAVAVKRTILVAFSASFAATVVDSIGD